MTPVVQAFVSRRQKDAPDEDSSGAELHQAVEDALRRARAAWPGLEVPDADVGEALAARIGEDGASSVSRLNAPDLYLVLACARGAPGAIEELERHHLPELRRAVERLGFAPSSVDEVLQLARATLFVVGEHGPPRIVEYGARGQLRGWLRVVVSRLAFRLHRPVRREVPLDESIGHEAKGDLELEYLKKTYGATFHEAFREALASLDVPERLLLKQRFTLHMTVVELGEVYAVHASTISRRVTEARERLVSATRAGMMQRLRLGAPEVSSIMRLIHSQVDITLTTHGDPSAREA